MPTIHGISKTSLWEAWKNIRKKLSQTSRRDITDYVEFDIDPDWWIIQLLKVVKSGRYEPATPYRFTLGKKQGFSRQMTFPHIPDIVLYRAVADYLYKRARRIEKGHVYFAQSTLSKKRKNIDNSDINESGYSGNAFARWKEFNQYRKRLLSDKIYPYIVLTDITNYFDSILYARVIDAVREVGVNRDIVGLLLFILERLSIRDAFNESPRIGLPIDEFDCSRTIAHMVLFPHDRRMIKLVEEEAYVRWMDDQAFGVSTFADGLKVLKSYSESLAKLHLTPNSSKSKVLSYSKACRHFHFDVNEQLDEVGKLLKDKSSKPQLLQKDISYRVKDIWRYAQKFEKDGGEWEKVLKRFYYFAGIGRAGFLRRRAVKDVLLNPTLAVRVSNYMRVTGSAQDYAHFVSDLWNHDEQIYPDVNRALAEGFLRVEADGGDAHYYRGLASKLLSEKHKFLGWEACAAIAPLVILRFGDRRSLPRFKKIVENLSDSAQPAIGKAVAVVYASYGEQEYEEVVKAASALRDNYLSHFLRMLDIALKYKEVPKRFKIRREPIHDTIARQKRIDMRKILVLRLLKLNREKAVVKWVNDARQWIESQDLSSFDKALVRKILS